VVWGIAVVAMFVPFFPLKPKVQRSGIHARARRLRTQLSTLPPLREIVNWYAIAIDRTSNHA
jgi:hypothetical protein